MALTILGFNLGIELMQLLVVALTIPWLLLLSRTPWYMPVRMAAAIFAAIAALAWIGQRAFEIPNPLDPLIAGAAQHGFWIIGILAALALLGTWQERARATLATDGFVVLPRMDSNHE